MNGKDTTKIYLYEVEEIRGNLMLQRLASSWVLVLFLIVDDLSLSLSFPLDLLCIVFFLHALVIQFVKELVQRE